MVATVHANGTAAMPPPLTVTNPITGAVVAQLPQHTPSDMARMVARARAAQPGWAHLGAAERARRLRAYADLQWAERDALMQVIRQETGKPLEGAYQEVLWVDNIVSYTFHTAPRVLRPQARKPVVPLIQRTTVYYHPYGVVGLLTPWNYPLALGLIDAIPALAAGNAIVLKPSEVTPCSVQFAVDLMHRAGIPQDVVQVAVGAADVGGALVDHADYVSFTGSTATGRRVAVRAAERLVPCTLELGGKDPLIVLADADLDLAASGAVIGAFENAGQACVSIERCYVEAAVHDEFVARVVELLGKLTVAASADAMMGSLTNLREVERCEAHIADALAKGARLVAGGRRRPDLGPLFFEPTVLTHVTHEMAVMREETFGPLLPIMRVADAREAVRLANDTDYGLSAVLFTRDLARGAALAQQLTSGDVAVNRAMINIATPGAPMGGRKHSGLGRRSGPEGILRFVAPQTVTVDTGLGAVVSPVILDARTKAVFAVLRVLRRWLPFV